MSQRPLHSAAELLRLIHNLVRLGTVAEVDHARARVRVATGEITTAWLPWLEKRAGTTRTWNPPTEGEQVVVFAPGGDMASAVVLAGLYRTQHPAPSDSADKWHAVMPDGAVIEYNHAASHLQATLPGSATLTAQGDVTVDTPAALTATAGGGATLNADTVINGTLAINGGSVTHNGTDIGDSHQHPQGNDSDGDSQQNTGTPL
ncbi:phage baseplate assembly protein V [Halomonas rhizosphaerae]|uniref:Phage baseplate assembly protein V n=1 Tax=Halomonas rhizosphaerae TaxID=3043296 RepID=A0ABT6V4D0_9GAMM|nr:phage baseplate assembly protein V [Halomonas rhizosphaerae]MDI5893080.1 phage baseplate assembly protein V [Halomonas rhizosphaerae]